MDALIGLLNAGMSVARFNFSHGSHEYHQARTRSGPPRAPRGAAPSRALTRRRVPARGGATKTARQQETLDNLRAACFASGKLCAVLLDTKGPEIRTGFMAGGKAVQLEKGHELTLTTDYEHQGTADCFAVSYKHLARDVAVGATILMADGALMLEVLSKDETAGTLRCRCLNSFKMGERKNCNLPGVIVDLPTLTDKDVDDIVNWGVKNRRARARPPERAHSCTPRSRNERPAARLLLGSGSRAALSPPACCLSAPWRHLAHP